MGFPVKRFSCLCFFLKSRTENCFLDLYLILNILMKTVGFFTPSIKDKEKSHITTFPEKRVIWKGLMCAMFWTVNLFFADTRHCVGHIQGLSRMPLKITFPGIPTTLRRKENWWGATASDWMLTSEISRFHAAASLNVQLFTRDQRVQNQEGRNRTKFIFKNVLNRPKIISLQNPSEKW